MKKRTLLTKVHWKPAGLRMSNSFLTVERQILGERLDFVRHCPNRSSEPDSAKTPRLYADAQIYTEPQVLMSISTHE